MGRLNKKHLDKEFTPLVQRFREAYFDRIPDGLRLAVRDEFCETFGYKVPYFHHKVLGTNSTVMLEMECEWMETCDAIAIYKRRRANRPMEVRKRKAAKSKAKRKQKSAADKAQG